MPADSERLKMIDKLILSRLIVPDEPHLLITKCLRFEQALRSRLPGVDVHWELHDWSKSILWSAAEVVETILKGKFKSNVGSDLWLVFIGHSVGGLVYRIANAILNDASFSQQLELHGRGWSQEDRDKALAVHRLVLEAAPSIQIKGVALLATPNSGGLRWSQSSALSNLAKGAVKAFEAFHDPTLAGIVEQAKQIVELTKIHQDFDAGQKKLLKTMLNARLSCVEDVASDRTFRLLQHLRVDTPCLSVSGSAGNRLSGHTSLGSLVRTVGVDLSMPHDGVVEDRSVNLAESLLPHEFQGTYNHLRTYRDCIDGNHFDLFEREVVLEPLVEAVRGWLP
jgi:hypothetical protein